MSARLRFGFNGLPSGSLRGLAGSGGLGLKATGMVLPVADGRAAFIAGSVDSKLVSAGKAEFSFALPTRGPGRPTCDNSK
jgi:hypothetical protein